MVFCIVREQLTAKIPAIENAIKEHSMHVFSSGFHQEGGMNYPLALCTSCPVLYKRRNGMLTSNLDCRFHEYLVSENSIFRNDCARI